MPEQPTQTQDTVTQAIITCDGAYLPSSARHFCPVRPSVDATLRSLWTALDCPVSYNVPLPLRWMPPRVIRKGNHAAGQSRLVGARLAVRLV